MKSPSKNHVYKIPHNTMYSSCPRPRRSRSTTAAAGFEEASLCFQAAGVHISIFLKAVPADRPAMLAVPHRVEGCQTCPVAAKVEEIRMPCTHSIPWKHSQFGVSQTLPWKLEFLRVPCFDPVRARLTELSRVVLNHRPEIWKNVWLYPVALHHIHRREFTQHSPYAFGQGLTCFRSRHGTAARAGEVDFSPPQRKRASNRFFSQVLVNLIVWWPQTERKTKSQTSPGARGHQSGGKWGDVGILGDYKGGRRCYRCWLRCLKLMFRAVAEIQTKNEPWGGSAW